ncbi:MAG: hypothetical protein DRH50_15305, partial [Deltaproteobacteria bacterium]
MIKGPQITQIILIIQNCFLIICENLRNMRMKLRAWEIMSLFRIVNKILSTQKCSRAMLWALCMPGSLQKMDFTENDRGLFSGVPMPVALMSRTILDKQVLVAASGIG